MFDFVVTPFICCMFLISLFIAEYEAMSRDKFVRWGINLTLYSTNMSY